MAGKTREKPVLSDHIYCNHCENLLSSKTFKKHHRLYFHEGRWLKGEDSRSGSSSPLDVSPPQPISPATLLTSTEMNISSEENVTSVPDDEGIMICS